MGLVGVLSTSVLIEVLVTSSFLLIFARVGIGIIPEVEFLSYIGYLDCRTEKFCENGDFDKVPDAILTS